MAVDISTWESILVGDCLQQISLAGIDKIQTSDYKRHGAFPVVDQGASDIAGWTDSDQAVIRHHLPVVVFGDHTRALKYIDRPFARGADGTQILKPKPGIDDLFFYYACRAINLESKGYARHFGELKESTIRVPPRRTQLFIAQALLTMEQCLNISVRVQGRIIELKTSVMHQLFTRGLRGESQKESEIGPIPESWDITRLDTVARSVSTRMSYEDLKTQPSERSNTAVRVLGIKVSDMNLPGNESSIGHSALERSVPQDLVIRNCAPPGTVVFPKRGAAIATNKKRLTTTWTVFDPNIIGVASGEHVDGPFLYYWFEHFDLRTITEPGPTPQINKKNVDPLLIPLPVIEEQRSIAELLGFMDDAISHHREKHNLLQELFQSLLNGLMSGGIDVNSLDLNAIVIA